jgi:hypothetical protein
MEITLILISTSKGPESITTNLFLVLLLSLFRLALAHNPSLFLVLPLEFFRLALCLLKFHPA